IDRAGVFEPLLVSGVAAVKDSPASGFDEIRVVAAIIVDKRARSPVLDLARRDREAIEPRGFAPAKFVNVAETKVPHEIARLVGHDDGCFLVERGQAWPIQTAASALFSHPFKSG